MNFAESFKQAISSLRANKLRSFLTMLGIIMGVFSIITIVAIGNATQGYINTQFEKIGANVVTISYKTRSVEQRDWLTVENMELIKKAAPEIKNIATYIQKSGSLRIGSATRDASVYGVSSQYKSFAAQEILNGRPINDIDIQTKANVIIIDEKFALKYFRKTDVVGNIISLRNSTGDTINIKIVGVAKSEEGLIGGMMDNENFPAIVYMPLTTVQSFFSAPKKLDSIMVSVVEKDNLKVVGEKIIKSLEIKNSNKDKYTATNSADQQKTFTNITDIISSVLLVIAIITLIVGGIGVVNILLVSVTERIREIGIRKALGAQKKDIIIQFITESIMMTGFSGIIGIIMGLIAGSVISNLIQLPPVVDIKVMVLSFLGSITLGLIFGVYPAKKAADLDPIESLRYE